VERVDCDCDKVEVMERFIGIKEDYTIIYLIDWPVCDVLITYVNQGHHCCGKSEESPLAEWEAVYYGKIIQDLKNIYPMEDWQPFGDQA
jgi:hypothetical protein